MFDEKTNCGETYLPDVLFFAADAVERIDSTVACRFRQQALLLRVETGSYWRFIDRYYGDVSLREKKEILVSAVLRGYSINQEDRRFAARYFARRRLDGVEMPFTQMSRKGVHSGTFELSDVCMSASVRVPNGFD